MENTLFSKGIFDDIVSRYGKILEINETKIGAIHKWDNLLKNGDLVDEIQNYGRFQDIILRQLLGYSIDDIKTNYVTEGSQSVEFVLFNKDNDAYVAIELKGSNEDLNKYRNHKNETVMQQASRYATSQKSFKWCIVSNYDTFIFFDKNSRKEFVSFKFEELNDKDILKKFLLIFSKVSLIENDLPSKLLDETIIVERNLEDEFYQLYSETRLMLIKELENSSQEIDRLEAINLAQLIINRFIFLCFAEDGGLIPPQTIADVLLTPIYHKNLFEFTMWNRLNEFFRFANQGNEEKGISAFNGGLFEKDLRHLEIRDKIEDVSFFDDCRTKWTFNEKYEDIENKLGVYKDTLNPIYKNLLTISSFDFGSELSVNILGHIFENSISDIEELKNDNIEQRRKEGVYYTPDYITDYICRNTIIPYLSKSGEIYSVPELIEEYDSTNSLQELDNKLKNIKIIDPACGSGSILNKSADILFEIHETLHAAMYAHNTSLDPILDSLESRKQIISENIFGVDLNEESVEITKLSLFLKIATSSGIKHGFKLPNLDMNIKCGNSLIDDESIAGNKAFNWHDKFPEVFENDGFDIIVGNPPYIKENVNKSAFDGLRDSPYYQGKMDLWTFFGCISLDLLKKGGLVSFIAPNNWITNAGASKFRDKVNKDAEILQFRNFGNYKVFDAAGIQTMIYVMKKNSEKSEYFIDYSMFKQERVESNDEVINFLYSDENNDSIVHFKSYYNRQENENSYLHFIDKNELDILNKINQNENIYFLESNEIATGIDVHQDFLNKKGAELLGMPVGSGIFVINNDEKENLNLSLKELELIKPYYTTNEIHKYSIDRDHNLWVIYTKSDINEYISSYPHIKEHFDKYSEVVTSDNKPYGLHRARNEDIFKDEKIIVTRKCLTPTFSYADFDTYVSQTFNVIKSERFDLKVLLGILNSNLVKFWLKKKGKMQGNNYQLDKAPLMEIPIKYVKNDLTDLIKETTTNILMGYEKFYEESNNFNKWLIRTISQNLNPILEYYELSFEEFLVELENQNINTKSRDIQELIEEEFNHSVGIIKPILLELKELEIKINKLVYGLYDLTDEEIEIIENSLK